MPLVRTITGAILSLLGSTSATAATATWLHSGTLTYVPPSLIGVFSVGQPFSVLASFDPAAADVETSNSGFGVFPHGAISGNIAGRAFSGAPSGTPTVQACITSGPAICMSNNVGGWAPGDYWRYSAFGLSGDALHPGTITPASITLNYRTPNSYFVNALSLPGDPPATWRDATMRITYAGPLGASHTVQGVIDSVSLVTPVPEPAEWATMLAGLGLIGWSARRKSVHARRP